jgi:hypothetical protein
MAAGSIDAEQLSNVRAALRPRSGTEFVDRDVVLVGVGGMERIRRLDRLVGVERMACVGGMERMERLERMGCVADKLASVLCADPLYYHGDHYRSEI